MWTTPAHARTYPDHRGRRIATRTALGRAGLLAGAVLAATLVAGCGTADTSAPMMAPEAVNAVAADEGAGTASTVQEKSVITSGSMSVDVADVAEAAGSLRSIVQGANGQIDEESQYSNPDKPEDTTVNMTLRVPADAFASVQGQIAGLGTVTSSSISKTDVTIQAVDIDARITALDASIQRLLSLIDQAQTTADLIEAENALTARQSELDSLKAQKAYLADQVSMSTLQVSLAWEGNSSQAGWQVALLILGIILGAIVVGIIWLVVWAVRRGHAPKATPTPAM